MTEQENKVWVDKDGIVNVRICKSLMGEEAFGMIELIREFLQGFKGKGRVLMNIIPYEGPFIATPDFRKKVADKIKETIKDPGFEKVAVFGGNTIIRTIASFIIVASGVKNLKVFSDEKKALKWLKNNN